LVVRLITFAIVFTFFHVQRFYTITINLNMRRTKAHGLHNEVVSIRFSMLQPAWMTNIITKYTRVALTFLTYRDLRFCSLLLVDLEHMLITLESWHMNCENYSSSHSLKMILQILQRVSYHIVYIISYYLYNIYNIYKI